MVKGYCVKCREMVDINDSEKIIMKNDRHAIKGKCPKCGTAVFKITGVVEYEDGTENIKEESDDLI